MFGVKQLLWKPIDGRLGIKITARAHNYDCSVTVYGPTFNYNASGWNQDYGGGTSCAGGVGTKTLTIDDQVLGPDGHTWYAISQPLAP